VNLCCQMRALPQGSGAPRSSSREPVGRFQSARLASSKLTELTEMRSQTTRVPQCIPCPALAVRAHTALVHYGCTACSLCLALPLSRFRRNHSPAQHVAFSLPMFPSATHRHSIPLRAPTPAPATCRRRRTTNSPVQAAHLLRRGGGT